MSTRSDTWALFEGMMPPLAVASPLSAVSLLLSPTSFRDTTSATSLTDEMTHVRSMSQICLVAEELVPRLYSYRNVVRCFPQGNGPADTETLNKEALRGVLQPEIVPLLRDMVRFVALSYQAINKTYVYLASCLKSKIPISEPIQRALIFTICGVLNVSTMLNSKQAMFQDWKRYKVVGTTDLSMDEILSIQTNVMTIDAIRDNLMNEIRKLGGVEEVSSGLLDRCANAIVYETYVLPTEKYAYIHVSGFLVGNILRTKLQKKDPVVLVLRRYPYIPLFAEVVCVLNAFYKVNEFLPPDVPESGEDRYLASYQIQSLRDEHTNVILSLHSVCAKASPETSAEDSAVVFKEIMAALKFLSATTQVLWEHCSWKYAHASTTKEECSDFARYMAKNHTTAELQDVLEIVNICKSVSHAMLNVSPQVLQCIQKLSYAKIQHFLQVTIRDHIRKGKSEKKKESYDLLCQIRESLGDWDRAPGRTAPKDHALDGVKDGPKQQGPPVFSCPNRACPPGWTQLWFLESTLSVLPKLKTDGKNPDFKEERLEVFRSMQKEIYYYRVGLRLQEAIMLCSDLSFLWSREWSLEMCKTNVFPITDSLLYVALISVFDSHTGKDVMSLKDAFNAVVCVYNDAATHVLSVCRTQHQYLELQMEVRVLIESVVLTLAEYLYRHAKAAAVTLTLPEEFITSFCESMLTKKEAKEKKKGKKTAVSGIEGLQALNAAVIHGWHLERLASVLECSVYTILGQHISLQASVSEHLHNYLSDDVYRLLDSACSTTPSRFAIESVVMYGVWSKTRDLLSGPSERYHLYLDSWESTWEGRCAASGIYLHNVWSLVRSVIVESCAFNMSTQRFVWAPNTLPPQLPSSFFQYNEAKRTATAYYALHADYFGAEHVEAVLEVLGKNEGIVALGLAIQAEVRVLMGPLVNAIEVIAAGGNPQAALTIHKHIGNLLCLANLVEAKVLGSTLRVLASCVGDLSRDKYVTAMLPAIQLWESGGDGVVWTTAAILRALGALPLFEHHLLNTPTLTAEKQRFLKVVRTVSMCTVMNAIPSTSGGGQSEYLPSVKDLVQAGLLNNSEPLNVLA